MTLNEFILKTKQQDDYGVRPRIICNDGFSMSVQGSKGHYCSPRQMQDWYTKMEIGYPSLAVEDLMQYAEDSDSSTQTVYGYVPCLIIENIIFNHGGIDETKTFPNSN